MTLPRCAERLTIYVPQTEHHGSVPDYVKIVERARRSGLAGATVCQATKGFGAYTAVRRRHGVLAVGVPVVVTVVETPERIDAFLTQIQDLATNGLMLRQPVEVAIHRTGRDRPDR